VRDIVGESKGSGREIFSHFSGSQPGLFSW
jgi:hypothetical protein